jgi:hypothetical protein
MSEINKHLTLFPSAEDTGHLSELSSHSRRDKDSRDVPAKHPSLPPKLPVKVRATTKPHSEDTVSVTAFCQQGSPWKVYKDFCRDDEAGPAIIACFRGPRFDVVAIKERDVVSGQKLDSLQKIQHDNVVHFLAAFQEADHLYLVYESVIVSLCMIQSGPMGPWRESELAAVCKQVSIFWILSLLLIAQVLSGLLFLQQTFSVRLPVLDASQVLVKENGVVKIGGQVADLIQNPR